MREYSKCLEIKCGGKYVNKFMITKNKCREVNLTKNYTGSVGNDIRHLVRERKEVSMARTRDAE